MSKNLISKQIFIRKFTHGNKKRYENLNSIVISINLWFLFISSQNLKAREIRKCFSYEIGSTKVWGMIACIYLIPIN